MPKYHMRQFINIAQNLLIEGPETEKRLARAQRLGYDTSRVWYHGSNAAFGAFTHEFVGQGHDQNGSGFYFTSSPDDASMYAGIKTSEDNWRKGDTPNVMPVFLRLTKTVPMEDSLNASAIKTIIEAADEDALWNFGDIGHEGRDCVLATAVRAYADLPGFAAMNALNNDFFRDSEGEFLKVFARATGMNHVMADRHAGVQHCVVFLPQDIRSIHAAFLNDTSDDIMA